MVAGVDQQLGLVDILVNNAGIACVQRADEISEQDWDEFVTEVGLD